MKERQKITSVYWEISTGDLPGWQIRWWRLSTESLYIIRRERIFVKSLCNSFKIAFAMFSKIPMPQAEWTKENMKYMFCFFPFIGTAIGALTLAASWAAGHLGLSVLFLSVILTVIPVLVTGGIHVDGLLDTADALSSWQERKRRL